MAQIALLGDCDMRIFAYGAARLLSELGTTMVVTTNPLFLLAAPENEDRFVIGDTHYLVAPSMEELFNDSYWDKGDYDFVLYDCQRTVPYDADVLVHIVTPNERRVEFQRGLYDMIECPTKLTIGYCEPSTKSPYLTKDTLVCPPAGTHITDVQKIETHRVYHPVSDAKMRKAIATILSNILQKPVDSIEKRLQRGWQNP